MLPSIVVLPYYAVFAVGTIGIGLNEPYLPGPNFNYPKLNDSSPGIANTTLSNESIPKKKKITDSGIEDRFFTKAHTIIRTRESKSLGATYINETRLDSHHLCLEWCVQIPLCNAAVYEEKNLQSCYLFDCGPPSRPLCRFTSHPFFKSSILKMTRHSYELSQWGKEAQLQLTSAIPKKSSATTSTSTASPARKETACHQYQFRCENSSECIAIYNVCDGIPQCPDSSDESPEINCPSKDENASQVRPNLKTDAVPSPFPSSSLPQHQESASGKKDPYLVLSPERAPYKNNLDESDGLGSPFVHKHSQFISASDPHLNRWANDYDQYPPSSQEQLYNPLERMDESYLPNPLSTDYENAKSYGSNQPEDFADWPNRDASYAADEISQPQVQMFHDKEIAYPRTAVNQYPESKLSMRQRMPNDYGMRRPPLAEDAAWLSTYQRMRQPYRNDELIRASIRNQLPNKKDPPNIEEAIPTGKLSLASVTSTAKGTDLKSDDSAPSHSIQKTVLDFKMSVAEMHESSETHSHEYSSAVLALVLGVMVSALLFLVLLCRLKTLHRSRRGKPLAHNADYLVNGMYL